MKILVDKMPDEPYKCPYCKDESNMDMDRYICKWDGSNRKCWNTSDCPFFVDMIGSNKVFSKEIKQMVIKDLKTLIDELMAIYETNGNMETIVMRAGSMFPEIELNVEGNTVYIEAYTEDEE